MAENGSMLKDVTFTKTIHAGLPLKFEAGTNNLLMRLGVALHYLDALNLQTAGLDKTSLLTMAIDALLKIPGCSIIGQAPHMAGLLSFNMNVYSALRMQGV